MRRPPVLLGLMLGLALLAAGCGGSSHYSLAKTKACMKSRGAKTSNKIANDFVASTASGGAFVADLGDNSVKVVFGADDGEAQQIQQSYQQFAGKNVQGGLPDVLKLYKNVVTLWHEHPQDSDLALMISCLK